MPCALWSTAGSPQGCMLGPLLLTPYWFAVLLSPNTATSCIRCQHSSHAKSLLVPPVEPLHKQQFVPASVAVLCVLKLLISAAAQTA